MKLLVSLRLQTYKTLIVLLSGFISLAIVCSVNAGLPEQKPLFLLCNAIFIQKNSQFS